MSQKKLNKTNNLFIDFFKNFKLFNKFNNKWDTIFNFCINYFQQRNYSKNIINVAKTIQSNKSFFVIIFILASWFWSSLILNFVYYFMLIDSLIISLLVLQNNCVETNSRRLAKNVILITLGFMNIIGGVFTLLIISFIYMEYSKFVGRLIFKLIKFFIKIIGNIFPPVYLLYPDIKLFNFEDPDMTIRDNSNKKNIKLFKRSSSDSSSSDSDVQGLNLSDSSLSKKKYKKYKKHNKHNKYKKNNSSFPTISTIKYDIFKNNKEIKIS